MSKIVLIVSLIAAAALAGCAGGGNKIEAIYELTALDPWALEQGPGRKQVGCL